MTLIYTEERRADITAARRPPSRVWGAQVGGLWPKVAHPQPGGRGVASRLSSAVSGHGSPGKDGHRSLGSLPAASCVPHLEERVPLAGEEAPGAGHTGQSQGEMARTSQSDPSWTNLR